MLRYPLAYNPILEYWEKIETGKIEVCNETRDWYRYLADRVYNPIPEMHYDARRGNHILEFAENYCYISKVKGAGKPVVLELWEKAHLAAIFGFIDDDGNRTCSEALLIVGKKNGKSLLASIVGLYMLLADGEKGPEVYSAATKRDQAKIIWQEASRMVKKCKALLRRCKCHVGDISSEEYNNGIFKPLASDSDSLDGLNIHCALLDEIHQWKAGRALYNILADGISAREQPLIYMTSTAGTIRQDIYDEKYDYAKMVINGLFDVNGYKDIHFFPFIYKLNKREEYTDPTKWIQANPNLGITKKVKYLEEKVKKAIADEIERKNTLCKEFNIRETSIESWLSFETINNTETFDIEKLKPRYGIMGCDLSSNVDLTNATVIFMVPNDERIYVLQMYFLPEDVLEKRVREDKIPYDSWKEKGYLRTTPGNKVHYKHVVEWFKEIQDTYDIYMFKGGYDAWSATYFVEDMKNEFGGGVMEPVHQGKKTLSGPMKSLGADLEKKIIIYNNNPILKWCLGNTSIDMDKNGNIQPCKSTVSTRRIDGMAGLLDAYVILQENLEDYMSMI